MNLLRKASLVTALGILTAGLPLAAASVYSTTLSGANETPATGSAGTGTALVTLNGDLLNVLVGFSGLGSPDAAGHIHCCGGTGLSEPIALPFTGFPTGVTSGTYNFAFDLATAAVYTTAFVTANGGTAAGAEAALIAGLNSGQSYVNIHTTAFPAGEIRGQLAAVPEPSTIMLGGAALTMLLFLRRNKLA